MSTIVTPLSAGVTREAVISVLHKHESYIKITCPQLIDYKHVSGTPGVGNTCKCKPLPSPITHPPMSLTTLFPTQMR